MEVQFFPILIGDIDSTNVRFNIVKLNSDLSGKPKIVNEKIFTKINYKSFLALSREYLSPYKDTDLYPQIAIIGLPATVDNNTIMQSLCFSDLNGVTGEAFGRSIGINTFIFFNDFTLNCYGVQSQLIEEEDYSRLNDNKPSENGTIALIGAGAGLRMGFMTKSDNEKYYDSYASEGGDQDFAPRTERQEKYRIFAIKHLQQPHLTVATSCFGIYLNVMYLFVAQEDEKTKGDMKLLEKVNKAKGNFEEIVNVDKEIISKGMSNECPICRKTIDFFMEIYGQIAGNFASAVFSTGGIYLVGDISALLEPYIRSNNIFVDNFIDKISIKPILQKIPIIIVKKTNLGLKGALEYARRIIEKTQKL